MPFDRTSGLKAPFVADPMPVLVEEVFRQLRRKERSLPARRVARVCPKIMVELANAALSAEFDAPDVLRGFFERGIHQNDLADAYIPAAARQLGCDWTEDRLSFAQVTVAAGRLQALLGRLGQPNDTIRSAHPDAPNVLLVSFEGDHHTMGWKLVSLQLRRRGAAVHAVLDIAPGAVADIVEHRRFDLLLVSASRDMAVDQVAQMVAALRARRISVPPIVLGGIVVDLLDGAAPPADVSEITNCLDKALSCRTRIPVPSTPALG